MATLHDGLGSTDPILLDRVADWGDDRAWEEFDGWCRRHLRAWCRPLGLSRAESEDLCQAVMVELADRMKAFRYDPSGSFRRWLRMILRSRATDYLRRRARLGHELIDEPESVVDPLSEDMDGPHDAQPGSPLDRLSAEVQEIVKASVRPETWRAFWMVRVEDRTVAEAAEALGRTYAATYRNQVRVAVKLRDEGRRRLSVRDDRSERESLTPR